MDELVARLREALDADERLANAARGVRLSGGTWKHSKLDKSESCWGTVVDGKGDIVVYGGLGFEGWGTAAWAADHIARHDPARVLRQVAAHRKTLARHQPVEQWGGGRGNVERWLVETHCSHCRGDGTEPGMYDNLSMPRPWPCAEIADLAEAYGIEVSSEV